MPSGCTLCLSCVSACPTGALRDDPERPMLRFVEDACVQCGLCQATCPEHVITLKPQIDFDAATGACPHPQGGRAVLLHPLQQAVRREEHDRSRGGEARGQALDVYRPSRRIDVIKMCEDCRVAAAAEEGFDPYGARATTIRTTDDYLREREAQNDKPGPGLNCRRFRLFPRKCIKPPITPVRPGTSPCARPAKACGSSFRCACHQFGRRQRQPLIERDVGIIAALEYLQEAQRRSSGIFE